MPPTGEYFAMTVALAGVFLVLLVAILGYVLSLRAKISSVLADSAAAFRKELLNELKLQRLDIFPEATTSQVAVKLAAQTVEGVSKRLDSLAEENTTNAKAIAEAGKKSDSLNSRF